MASLNTSYFDENFSLVDNIVTGDVDIATAQTSGNTSICTTQTSGNINIATSASRTGDINIGATGNVGSVSIEAATINLVSPDINIQGLIFSAGTWTPRLCQQAAIDTDPATSIYDHTIDIKDAQYTRIGNLVTVWCTFTVTSLSSSHPDGELARPVLSFLPYEVLESSVSPTYVRYQGLAEGNSFTFPKDYSAFLGNMTRSGVNSMNFCVNNNTIYQLMAPIDLEASNKAISVVAHYQTTDTGAANHFRDSF